MKQINYAELSEKIKANDGLVKSLNILDKAITYITVILYLGLLVYTFILGINSKGDFTLVYRSILIPAVSFVVVSIYRYLASAPRPYEVYNFVPAIKKNTVGKSFPSRHVFSIFLVAMTYGQISIPLALVIMLMGLGLCILRVVGGVHFLKDVIAGAILGIACGFIGFGILCGVFQLCVLVF